MNQNKIFNFLNNVHSNVGTVDYFETEFIKKDGSLRKMKFSLKPPEEIIKELEKKKKSSSRKPPKLDPKYLKVWDIEKQDFRIINTETMRFLKAKKYNKVIATITS